MTPAVPGRLARVVLLSAGFALSVPARADDALTFRGSFAWINAYVHTTPLSSAVNPDNRMLAVPNDEVVSEFRPNLKVNGGPLSLIFRPRVTATATQVRSGDKTQTATGDVDSLVSEAYGQWTISDQVTFAYGRQSYQWGAAESLSPSNRIFHETVQARNLLYEARGHDIARLNLSLGKSFNTVIMAEYAENKDLAPFTAEETFAKTGLIKPEFSWNNGADYLGLVFGGREHGHPWLGEYFNISVPGVDGLAFYGDAAEQHGTQAWYPVATSTATPSGPAPVTVFAQSKQDDDRVYTLAVAGLKYDFENGTILRGEYIYNEAGYDQQELDRADAAFAARAPTQLAVLTENTQRFVTPGLELPGQRFAYASLYVPDFLTVVDLGFTARSMYSLIDHTSSSYASASYKVGDAGTVSGATAAQTGKRDGELRGYSSPTYMLAYQHDW